MPPVVVQPPAFVHPLQLSPPPSKSVALRALVAASIAGGGELRMARPWPDDVEFMVLALTRLGVQFEELSLGLRVKCGLALNERAAVEVDAGEGAAPARFLLALAAGLNRPVTVCGRGRLPERPFAELSRALCDLGALVEGGPGLPLTVTGPVRSHSVHVSTLQSSQFLSGLLLAAPLFGGLDVLAASGASSPGYVALTRAVMLEYGVAVLDPCRVVAESVYENRNYQVEGDWSGAAFLLAAGAALGCEVLVPGMNGMSTQPDVAVMKHLAAMGCIVETGKDGVRLKGPALFGLAADLADTPDLAPVLLPLAATLSWTSRFRGLEKLELKESDRLHGLMQLLAAHGASVSLDHGCLSVSGPERHQQHCLVVETHGDHRMAMAGAVLGLARPVRIDDAGCVSKSFPEFFSQWPGAACPNRGH